MRNELWDEGSSNEMIDDYHDSAGGHLPETMKSPTQMILSKNNSFIIDSEDGGDDPQEDHRKELMNQSLDDGP